MDVLQGGFDVAVRADCSNELPSTSVQDSTEPNVSTALFKVFLWGTLVSSALFVAGIVTELKSPRFHPLTANWARQHYHWDFLWQGIQEADSAVLMLSATMVVILTPVVRLVAFAFGYAALGDRKLATVSGIVFCVMALSLLIAIIGLK
jgi:uncharacterized membrane protein